MDIEVVNLLDDCIELLKDACMIDETTFTLNNDEVRKICRLAREEMLTQPMLVEVSAPVVIVGDIHGQFADLLRIFKRMGSPERCSYIFLGDYVDRGPRSLEVMCLLLAFKARYQDRVSQPRVYMTLAVH